jgi:hypothetical protein
MSEVGDNSKIEVEYEFLQQVLDDLANSKKSVSEANGKHRADIKEIVDKESWNAQALGTIRMINDKSETGRADFLRTFEPLFAAMKEGRWDEDTADLFNEE